MFNDSYSVCLSSHMYLSSLFTSRSTLICALSLVCHISGVSLLSFSSQMSLSIVSLITGRCERLHGGTSRADGLSVCLSLSILIFFPSQLSSQLLTPSSLLFSLILLSCVSHFFCLSMRKTMFSRSVGSLCTQSIAQSLFGGLLASHTNNLSGYSGASLYRLE